MFNPALFSAFCFVAKPNSNGYTLSFQPTLIFLLNAQRVPRRRGSTVRSHEAGVTPGHRSLRRAWVWASLPPCAAGPRVACAPGSASQPCLCSSGPLRAAAPHSWAPLTLQGAVVRVEWPCGSGEGGPVVSWQSGGGGVWQSWENLVIWWHRQMAEVVQAMHGAVHGRGVGAVGLTSVLPQPPADWGPLARVTGAG